jgi:hypothetical protein
MPAKQSNDAFPDLGSDRGGCLWYFLLMLLLRWLWKTRAIESSSQSGQGC